MKLYLSTRDVKSLFDNENLTVERVLKLKYDIPGWDASSEESLLTGIYRKEVKYHVKFDSNIRRKVSDFIEMNKDKDLSLQILYRDGNIKDFWPKWTLQI